MKLRLLVVLCGFAVSSLSSGVAFSQEKTQQPERVRLGGVAYAPKMVTVFRNLTTYLNGKGFSSDFVLYGNHEELTTALGKGDIDIAWMDPMTHGRYHVQYGSNSQALAMRDVDRDLRVTLIVRKESGIASPKDLAGKQLIVGRSGSQDGSLLPLHYFRQSGVNVGKVKIVSLKGETDAKGNRADRAEHILKALEDGRGDAAIVLESAWNKATKFQKSNPNIATVWTSPEFCHCTFTAPGSFNKQLGSQFTRLMTKMDPSDPIVAELLRLEDAQRFVPSDPKGFGALYQALSEKKK
jgi:ABC-type phosphate/phosphonate transport system substrate-binding protein